MRTGLRLAGGIVIGSVIGNIVAIPVALAIDAVCGASVTGGQWSLTAPNIIYSGVTGLLTGLAAGFIAGRKGWLIGALAQCIPLIFVIVASVVTNRAAPSTYEVPPATWTWIGLIPAIVGGRLGERLTMSTIGKLLQGLGWTVFAVSGIWGFLLCLSIITKVAGFWGLVVAIFVAPVTFIAAPLYAGFAWHNWFPLVLNYGGGIVASLLVAIGGALNRDE